MNNLTTEPLRTISLTAQLGMISGLIGFLMAACSAPTSPTSLPATASPDTETAAVPSEGTEIDPFVGPRREMVRVYIEGGGILNDDVLRAMRAVPRHEFVPAEYLSQAYDNHPLPIGYGQTISQPYIVGWMTELLELQPGERVLEIGTGSGYQAAILAELGFVDVYTIEIVPALADLATQRLRDLGYDDVHVRQGDGYHGWPEAAPFDAIIVTAAPDHLPAPLVAQLAGGGRLVIPIGPAGFYQSLWQFVNETGELTAYNMGGVSFVPFTGPGIETAPSATP